MNLDLIYGLPLQTEESVARTARRALALDADRVAVFGYAHVPWMKKHQQLIPEETLPGPLARFRQQHGIHRVLTEEGGYIPVGLDHYARPGDSMAEAAATRRLHRSFQGYTDDAAPALIGFGASAIGSLPQGYVQNAPTALAYGKAIEAGGLAIVRGITLTADDRLRRDLIERLMCDLDVDVVALAAAHEADPAPLAAALAGLAPFAADGLADWDGARLRVSEKGRPFVRSVAALFDAYLSQADDKPRHSRAV
jgi:oxygen-independent coproporphyrinogen-3 oxidase